MFLLILRSVLLISYFTGKHRAQKKNSNRNIEWKKMSKMAISYWEQQSACLPACPATTLVFFRVISLHFAYKRHFNAACHIQFPRLISDDIWFGGKKCSFNPSFLLLFLRCICTSRFLAIELIYSDSERNWTFVQFLTQRPNIARLMMKCAR